MSVVEIFLSPFFVTLWQCLRSVLQMLGEDLNMNETVSVKSRNNQKTKQPFWGPHTHLDDFTELVINVLQNQFLTTKQLTLTFLFIYLFSCFLLFHLKEQFFKINDCCHYCVFILFGFACMWNECKRFFLARLNVSCLNQCSRIVGTEHLGIPTWTDSQVVICMLINATDSVFTSPGGVFKDTQICK